jgi:DNA polymerase-4
VNLPISVGAATTKHLAKIASRVAKPDGMLVVEPGSEAAFLDPLPVGHLWGVGPVGERRLAGYGVRTIGDLAAVPPDTLAAWLGGYSGRHLWHLAHNHDGRPVERGRQAGSVGAQSAGEATATAERHTTLLALADRVGTRLRRKGRAGRRITVRTRFADMTSVTRTLVLPAPIAETTSLYRAAAALADGLIAERASGRRVNLVGVSVDQLEDAPHLQLELPLGPGEGPHDPALRAGSETHRRLRALDAAVDGARSRFSRDAVRRAAILGREPEVRSPTDAAADSDPQPGRR